MVHLQILLLIRFPETASTAGSANVSGNSSLPDTAQIKKDSSGTDIKSPQCGEKNCFTLLLDDFIEILKKVLIFLGFSSKIWKKHTGQLLC